MCKPKKNSKWQIQRHDEDVAYSTEEIQREVVHPFQCFFQKHPGNFIKDQIWCMTDYPLMLNHELNEEVYSSVTSDEILQVLKLFAKDKSLNPDRWTMEFFLYFYDLVGADMLNMVEESRSLGHVTGPINSIFVALIPKTSATSPFLYYRPISLCYITYKLISKVIAKRNPLTSHIKGTIGFPS